MSARLALLPLLAILATAPAPSQISGGFDLDRYTQFLATHQNLETPQLLAMYPAGTFCATTPPGASEPAYLDSIDRIYGLTLYEKELLRDHGFVVSQRLARHTMVEALGEIHRQDLPVFVSTDAVLEAVHLSYDTILKEIEHSILAPQLDELLVSLHAQLPVLDARYSTTPAMARMLRDVDIYLTVPLDLLGKPVSPYYPENRQAVEELIQYIKAEQPEEIPLFATTKRIMDFSQFTVRGHYSQDSILARYFRAMIWLGRTEIYLTAPEGTITEWPPEDIQRQTIDALLVAEAVQGASAMPMIDRMDTLITYLVGESDNVTLRNLTMVAQELGIKQASDLIDVTQWNAFEDTLKQRAFAFQRINSQILMTDPFNPEQLTPASAVMLLGQRFVIDSYIAWNVVYDRILFNDQKVRRMLPSTLDVLFSLGNNAAAQLLEPELTQYHYASNLAALRYLVDSFDEEFWKGSLFNGWLRMIRTLNPPLDRSGLPPFMQTAAWWQEKINTQLASWAQLRHDNLLYAKQSYTGGIICSYPESFVEPIPEFYVALREYAGSAAAMFGTMGLTGVQQYFHGMAGTADTLGIIAQKELAKVPLSPQEGAFLRSMLFEEAMCGSPYLGWYPRLFYGHAFVPRDSERKTDFLVADVHTAPTDEDGNPVGWVLHVGTGPVDLAVVVAETPAGLHCAFVGPVLNYYEHVAVNFKRLTDEEWETMYDVAPTLRPGFVNIYLANTDGESRGAGPSLLTGVEQDPVTERPGSYALYQNFPNPFNASTIIPFSIPASSSGGTVKLEVYDIHGRLVAKLLDRPLPAGNYTARWDGTTQARTAVSSGVYFCRLSGEHILLTKKMVLLR
jgi:hypothetical protein